MKKKFLPLLIISLFFVKTTIIAQTPEAFQYQAVVRDALGDVATNQAVTFKLSILQGSLDNPNIAYQEIHKDTTNAFGLVNFNVGTGEVESGSFSEIQWNENTHYLQIEIDLQGNGAYKNMGTSQLISVPYALHAKTAGNIFSGNYYDLENLPNLSNYVLLNETATWDKDTGNELQTLSIDGYTLSLSKTSQSNNVQLPDSVRFATYAGNPGDAFEVDYSRVVSKPQLSISNDTIFLTHGGYADLPDTIEYAKHPTDDFQLHYDKVTSNPDEDLDKTNEIQNLTISNDTIFLDRGDAVKLPDSIHYAEIADSVPKLQKQIDSLEQLLSGKVDQSVVDSLEKRLNAQANNNWLSKTDGFYIDSRDKIRYNFNVIGAQVWLTENLNTGDTIQSDTDAAHNDTIEKYSYADNDANLAVYGGLYTWREMMQLPDTCETNNCTELIEEQHQGICPDGWHIPDMEEWTTLIDEFGGTATAGDALKSTSSLWTTSVTNNNNFTAEPGGQKQTGNNYYQITEDAYFGVSREKSANTTTVIHLEHDSDDAFTPEISKGHAVSVRCIQDE